MLFNCEGEPSRRLRGPGGGAVAGREGRPPGAGVPLHDHLLPGGDRAAPRRERELHRCAAARARASSRSPRPPSTPIPTGSRLAIRHFTEYLEQFPDDLEVRWLLNLAHMTLGEHPRQGRSPVPDLARPLPQVRVRHRQVPRRRPPGRASTASTRPAARSWRTSTTTACSTSSSPSCDPTEPMAFYRNKGDGTFEDRTRAGRPDRPARRPVLRPDRLQQRRPPGHLHPARRLAPHRRCGPACCATTATARSPTSPRRPACSTRSTPTRAAWADYDNDGWLDLFVCCERQPNRLYHNRGDGTFEEVAARAGVHGRAGGFCKGAAWIDFDNDGYPDLFVNNLNGRRPAVSTTTATAPSPTSPRPWASTGPRSGFSCWAWDYDNDGWLDIFATCYDRTLERRGQGPARPAARPACPTGSSATWAARASRT